MSKKIRTERIAKGWANKAFGERPDFSQPRKDVCMGCEFRDKVINFCTICKCEVDAKSRVADEYCPKNLWHDIKHYEGKGVSIRIHDPHLMKLSVVDEDMVLIEYNEPFQLNCPVKHTTIKFDLINTRADLDGVSSAEATLKDFQLKICGCFEAKIDKDEIRDGQKATVTLTYNTKLLGQIDKTLRIVTNKDTYYVKIKGEVKV